MQLDKSLINNRLLFRSFLIWRKKHIQDNHFIILLSIVTGFIAAIAVILLKKAVHLIQNFLTSGFLREFANYQLIFYPAVGIFLVILFTKFILRKPIGHGIPDVLYAISRNSGQIPGYHTFSSLIASAITVGFGGSVGLEGPSAATGAAIGSNMAKWLKIDYKRIILMIGCATAGAIAAIFKAPIAGILFAIEVLMLDLTMKAVVPLLAASATAALTSYAILGPGSIYEVEVLQAFAIHHLPEYVLLGVLTGFISVYFTRVYNSMDTFFATKFKNWFQRFLAGSVMLGVLIFFFPALYGEGYEAVSACLKGDFGYIFNNSLYYDYRNSIPVVITLFLAIIIFKVVASCCTFGSGGIGGIFAPAIFMGANTGLFVATFLNYTGLSNISSTNFALVGMAGLIAGVVHAPLTAIFMIAETTGGYSLFLPLMIVSAISYFTINYFEDNSIYTRQLAKSGELFTHDKDKMALQLLNLDRLLETNFHVIHIDSNLRELVNVIAKSKRNVFPVIDDEGVFLGIVHLNNIRQIIFKPELYDTTPVSSLMHYPANFVEPGDSMEEVVEKFNYSGHYNLPVLKDNKYIGFLSRANVLLEYRKMLKRFSGD